MWFVGVEVEVHPLLKKILDPPLKRLGEGVMYQSIPKPPIPPSNPWAFDSR